MEYERLYYDWKDNDGNIIFTYSYLEPIDDGFEEMKDISNKDYNLEEMSINRS